MSPASSSVQFARFMFESFDHASGELSLDWQQLDAGHIEFELTRAETAKANVGHVAFNRKFLQRGISPPDSITFGILDGIGAEIDWCRRRASSEHLLIFGTAREYESVSHQEFSGSRLSIDLSHFEGLASCLGLSVNLELLSGTTIPLTGDQRILATVRNQFRRFRHSFSSDTDQRRDTWIRDQIETEIPVQILQFLASKRNASPGKHSRFRVRAACMARDFMDEFAAEVPTMPEVCRAVGVSWRALNYAFRDLYDLTPKQYLLAVRLNGVRRELSSREPPVLIRDVANSWGFWHMGKLAADYRKHFGELPSETVLRIHSAAI